MDEAKLNCLSRYFNLVEFDGRRTDGLNPSVRLCFMRLDRVHIVPLVRLLSRR